MALTDAEFILLGSGSVVVYCWETPRGPRLRWENDSKMKIKKKICGYALDSSGLGYCSRRESCIRRNERSGFIKKPNE